VVQDRALVHKMAWAKKHGCGFASGAQLVIVLKVFGFDNHPECTYRVELKDLPVEFQTDGEISSFGSAPPLGSSLPACAIRPRRQTIGSPPRLSTPTRTNRWMIWMTIRSDPRGVGQRMRFSSTLRFGLFQPHRRGVSLIRIGELQAMRPGCSSILR
jgi:hypothetical protein